MSENREILGQDDVIRVDEGQRGFMRHTVFTANDFTCKIRSEIHHRGFYGWKDSPTIDADVLVAGKYWRKGKLVLRIEFIPDESILESPLDEFRNQ